MSICWYCHWGWPKPVADIYLAAIDKLGGNDGLFKYGPSHIVWESENFHFAKWCLENFDKYRGDETDEQAKIIRWSLKELAKLPFNVIDVVPDGYDGEHPENYPPPDGVVMVECG